MIRELKEKISRLTKKINEAHPILDFKALDSQNKDLTVKVNALQDLNERFRAENEKVKHHYKELYDSIKLTRVKGATSASRLKPRSNTKKDRNLPAKSVMNKVEDHPRNNKSSVKRKNRIDSSISYKRTVINSNSNSVCKSCNNCLMSFNHDTCGAKSLKFVKKPRVKKVWRVKQVKQVWQPTRKLFATIGHQ
nr:hypothetical protein [Tanacetum cinerariifolium]